MKIDLSKIDREQFTVRDCVIAGDECALVFPSNMGVDWTPETLHLRSIICLKSDGKIISRGHDKFFNHTEKPHLYPDPAQFDDWRVSTKEDGSLIIVSYHRNEMIIRTRGTATIDVYETGPEVRRLLADFGADRWLDLRDTLHSNSLLFEHCTPSNPIVIRYDKPRLVLLDAIAHDGTYWSAKQVDQLALCLGCLRPDTHTFSSLSEITETLNALRGMEGFVLAYNDNRNRIKLKGLEYLKLHAFRSTVSLGNLLDLFFLYSRPTVDEFLARLEREFDWESAQMAITLVTLICQAHERAEDRVHAIQEAVWYGIFEGYKAQEIRLGTWKPTRRDYALAIQSRFKEGLGRSVAFGVLDKKLVDDKMMRRLMEAHLS